MREVGKLDAIARWLKALNHFNKGRQGGYKFRRPSRLTIQSLGLFYVSGLFVGETVT